MADASSSPFEAAQTTCSSRETVHRKRGHDDVGDYIANIMAPSVPNTSTRIRSSVAQLPSPASFHGTSSDRPNKDTHAYSSKRQKRSASTKDEARDRSEHELYREIYGNVTMQNVYGDETVERCTMTANQCFESPGLNGAITLEPRSGGAKTADPFDRGAKPNEGEAEGNAAHAGGPCLSKKNNTATHEALSNNKVTALAAADATQQLLPLAKDTSVRGARTANPTHLHQSEIDDCESFHHTQQKHAIKMPDESTDSSEQVASTDQDRNVGDGDGDSSGSDDSSDTSSEGSSDDENTHYNHCGAFSCRMCVNRQPGFQLWHVDEAPVEEFNYIPGVSALARAYDGSKNVLMMAVARSLFQKIEVAVEEGRKYRATKTKIEDAASELQKLNQPAYTAYRCTKDTWTNARRELTRQRHVPNRAQRKHIKSLKNSHQEAAQVYRTFIERRQDLRRQADTADRAWMQAMRKVNHEHECLFAESGLFPIASIQIWSNREYAWGEFLHPHGNGVEEIYDHNPHDAFSSDDDLSESLDDDSREAESQKNSETQSPIDRLQQQLSERKAEFRRAYAKHENLRYEYEYRFNTYVAEHADHSHDDLAENFGPEYFALWKQGIQEFQAADDALVKARAERDEQLAADEAEQQKKAERNRHEEAVIEAQCQRALEDVNRGKILSWIEKLHDEFEPAVLSEEDNVKLWTNPLYRLVMDPAAKDEQQNESQKSIEETTLMHDDMPPRVDHYPPEDLTDAQDTMGRGMS